jgi:hypothetical protein
MDYVKSLQEECDLIKKRTDLDKEAKKSGGFVFCISLVPTSSRLRVFVSSFDRTLIKAKNEEISTLITNKHNLFASTVEQDENPQKYLYQVRLGWLAFRFLFRSRWVAFLLFVLSPHQAYRRRWRLYKLYQMFEKLALLGITLYVSQTKANTWRRLAGATGLATVSLVIVAIGHPLNDKWEAALDITSRSVLPFRILHVSRFSTRNLNRLANAFNCGIGLIVELGLDFPAYAINICMISVNGLNIAVFIANIFFGPVR